MSTEFAPDAHAESEFVCDCPELWRSACVGEGFFREHIGQRYCVLHYPGQDKAAAFKTALQKKLETQDFDFRSVWFPEAVSFEGIQFSSTANFCSATFSADASFYATTFSATVNFRFTTFSAEVSFTDAYFSADADFRYATFSGDACFNSTKFSGDAGFRSTTFSADADFIETTFNANADFTEAIFKVDANFGLAIFSADADFVETTFNVNANFNGTNFAAYVRFAKGEEHPVFGDRSYLNLQFARIEKPERVSFHHLTLRPHWFVNVDTRKFEFVNVAWHTGVIPEIESLGDYLVSSPYHRLPLHRLPATGGQCRRESSLQ